MTATHIQDVKYANRACAKNINRNRLLPVFSFIFQFHCWTASIQWMLNIVTNWENNHTINSCDYVRAISVFQLNFERLRFEWIWPSTLECHVLENGHWISHLLRRSSNFRSLLFFVVAFLGFGSMFRFEWEHLQFSLFPIDFVGVTLERERDKLYYDIEYQNALHKSIEIFTNSTIFMN